MTSTFEHCLAEFDQERRKPHRQPPAHDAGVPVVVTNPMDRAMIFLRKHYLDGESTEILPTIAGMETIAFRRAFRVRFGKTPAAARAELQVADMQALLRQGVLQSTLRERLGFSSSQRMSNAFREVTGKSPGEWLAEEREQDPSIPAQPDRTGWSRGIPKSAETRAKLSAAVAASWSKRARPLKKIAPPSTVKGPQPVLTGAALAAAEIKRGARAFDEYQRRMAAEREATAMTGGFVAKETRPSRHRDEPAPINPQFIPVVDNTPTAATCFDRFPRERGRGAAGDGGEFRGSGDDQ